MKSTAYQVIVQKPCRRSVTASIEKKNQVESSPVDIYVMWRSLSLVGKDSGETCNCSAANRQCFWDVIWTDAEGSAWCSLLLLWYPESQVADREVHWFLTHNQWRTPCEAYTLAQSGPSDTYPTCRQKGSLRRCTYTVARRHFRRRYFSRSTHENGQIHISENLLEHVKNVSYYYMLVPSWSLEARRFVISLRKPFDKTSPHNVL